MYIRDKNGKLVPVQTIKGKDYVLTEADKNEMVNAVINALPKYNGEVEPYES
jgi:hypothetical protein